MVIRTMNRAPSCHCGVGDVHLYGNPRRHSNTRFHEAAFALVSAVRANCPRRVPQTFFEPGGETPDIFTGKPSRAHGNGRNRVGYGEWNLPRVSWQPVAPRLWARLLVEAVETLLHPHHALLDPPLRRSSTRTTRSSTRTHPLVQDDLVLEEHAESAEDGDNGDSGASTSGSGPRRRGSRVSLALFQIASGDDRGWFADSSGVSGRLGAARGSTRGHGTGIIDPPFSRSQRPPCETSS